jgi:hypothetical protein
MPADLQLKIAEPCHENWNRMDAAERGRFCQSCQETVTDFTLMDDKEILQFLSRKSESVCGRFTADQLNRALLPEHKKRFSWKYAWNLMLVTFLSAGDANAQSKQPPTKKKIVNKTNKPTSRGSIMGFVALEIPKELKRIEGTVRDGKTNAPIPFATVVVKGTANGASADSNGYFVLPVLLTVGSEITLEITAIGYEKQEYKVRGGGNIMNFYLDPAVTLLGEVQVNAIPPKVEFDRCLPIVMGGISPALTVTIQERVNRKMSDWVPKSLAKKALEIYPNPVIGGNTVNVTTHLPEAGEYRVAVLNAGGQLVYFADMQLNSKTQVINIPTSPNWAKGVYWVRLEGGRWKKVFNAKLVLR